MKYFDDSEESYIFLKRTLEIFGEISEHSVDIYIYTGLDKSDLFLASYIILHKRFYKIRNNTFFSRNIRKIFFHLASTIQSTIGTLI